MRTNDVYLHLRPTYPVGKSLVVEMFLSTKRLERPIACVKMSRMSAIITMIVTCEHPFKLS